MKFLITFISVEGQTRRVAETIADHLEDKGHAVALLDIANMSEFALERPDAVILAAPIHGAHYPAPFIDFVRREKALLEALPSAFLSLSLLIHSQRQDEIDEARSGCRIMIWPRYLRVLAPV